MPTLRSNENAVPRRGDPRGGASKPALKVSKRPMPARALSTRSENTPLRPSDTGGKDKSGGKLDEDDGKAAKTPTGKPRRALSSIAGINTPSRALRTPASSSRPTPAPAHAAPPSTARRGTKRPVTPTDDEPTPKSARPQAPAPPSAPAKRGLSMPHKAYETPQAQLSSNVRRRLAAAPAFGLPVSAASVMPSALSSASGASTARMRSARGSSARTLTGKPTPKRTISVRIDEEEEPHAGKSAADRPFSPPTPPESRKAAALEAAALAGPAVDLDLDLGLGDFDGEPLGLPDLPELADDSFDLPPLDLGGDDFNFQL